MLFRALALSLVATLALASCKSRNAAQLKSEDVVARVDAAPPEDGLRTDPAATKPTMTELKAVEELLPTLTAMESDLARSVPATGSGLGLADDAPVTSTSTKAKIQSMTEQLAIAKAALARLEELGDDSSERVELKKTVDRLQAELGGKQTQLQQLQVQEQTKLQQEAEANVRREERQRQQQQQQLQAQQKVEQERQEAKAKAAKALEKTRRILREILEQETTIGYRCLAFTRQTASTKPGLTVADIQKPWDAAKVRALAQELAWSSAASLYIEAGAGFRVDVKAVNFLLVQHTSCGTTFAGDLGELTLLGEYDASGYTTQLYAAYNPSNPGQFNSATAKNITMFAEFFRKDAAKAAAAKEAAASTSLNPERASKIFTTGYDCSSIASNNVGTCDSWDCKAIVGKNAGLCDTNDCRAIVAKDSNRCDSYDCQAIVLKARGLCDSQYCLAIVTKNGNWCTSDRKTNAD